MKHCLTPKYNSKQNKWIPGVHHVMYKNAKQNDFSEPNVLKLAERTQSPARLVNWVVFIVPNKLQKSGKAKITQDFKYQIIKGHHCKAFKRGSKPMSSMC